MSHKDLRLLEAAGCYLWVYEPFLHLVLLTLRAIAQPSAPGPATDPGAIVVSLLHCIYARLLHALLPTPPLPQGRLRTLALCESSREDVVANIQLFLHPANVYKVRGQGNGAEAGVRCCGTGDGVCGSASGQRQ